MRLLTLGKLVAGTTVGLLLLGSAGSSAKDTEPELPTLPLKTEPLVREILLKPTRNNGSTGVRYLTDAEVEALSHELGVQMVLVLVERGSGVHHLRLETPMSQVDARALAQRLATLPGVGAAEAVIQPERLSWRLIIERRSPSSGTESEIEGAARTEVQQISEAAGVRLKFISVSGAFLHVELPKILPKSEAEVFADRIRRLPNVVSVFVDTGADLFLVPRVFGAPTA
jgi:hypothetical protein